MITASRIRQLLGLPLSPDEQRDLRGQGPLYPEEAGPGISSREPRWSEKMAGLLFGDQRRSMGQQRMADTVASLAGLTPLGALDASGPQEAAMAILPGSGGRMGKEAMAAAKEGIRAYHGSPHSFDKFELSPKTIGTGEGAQAYGHGLYFAGNEKVAKDYRKQLADNTFTSPSGSMTYGNVYTTLEDVGSKLGLHPDQSGNLARQVTEKLQRGAPLDDIEYPVKKFNDAYYAMVEEAQKRGFKPNPGHMYEVNINARPEQFLDWDKPLAQQEQAKAAAQQFFPKGKTSWGFEPKTGEDLYKSLSNTPATTDPTDPLWRFGNRNPDVATARLKEAGIPGIQYLDAGSRSAGQGTSNYVVFDDRLIDILRKYGLAGAAPLGGAAALSGGQEE